jgi:hypothetical protein
VTSGHSEVADNVIAPAAKRGSGETVTPADEVLPVLERWALAGRAEKGITVPPVRLSAIDGFRTSVAAFATDLPSLTNGARPPLRPGSVHGAHRRRTRECHELNGAVDDYVRLATAAVARLAS